VFFGRLSGAPSLKIRQEVISLCPLSETGKWRPLLLPAFLESEKIRIEGWEGASETAFVRFYSDAARAFLAFPTAFRVTFEAFSRPTGESAPYGVLPSPIGIRRMK
jgi:hypothetical protein